MSVRVRINPEVVQWAADWNAVSADQLAMRMGISSDRIEAWLQGSAEPTFLQARNLADRLRIPFGYLFLNEVPQLQHPLPDFRARTEAPSSYSPDLTAVLNDALRKRDWYRSSLLAQGAQGLDFIGKFSVASEPSTVAADMHKTMLTHGLYEAATSWSAYLSQLTVHAEAAGILVLRTGTVGSNTHRPLSPEEFQGFAISDSIAPIVLINGKDSHAAQIFTFAHEIAHLWLGSSGVSLITETDRELTADIEIACNRIATEFLVPEPAFLASISQGTIDIEAVSNLARQFRVSALVIVRRLRELRQISDAQYRELRGAVIALQTPRRGGSGGNFYTNMLLRNSRRFTKAVVDSVNDGNLGYVEGAQLLGESVGVLGQVLNKAANGEL